jgi:signal transduction histidine kinase/CheY-like chemotaxis protein
MGVKMNEQPLVLVVDDEPIILKLVKEILSPEGFQVETAGNGKEALRAIQAQPFDVVLTDMIMPDMTGMELVQYLRLHHPDTPVIVFTGYANYEDAVEAVRQGAFDYLPKPVQSETLRHSLRQALDYQRLVRAQKDLETVFLGAEALGLQALELVSSTKEAAILGSLQDRVAQEDLGEVGRQFLQAAHELVQVTNSSIFLYNAVRGEFTGLAAVGPEAEIKVGLRVAAERIMGYVATHQRPLLVPDLSRDRNFALLARRTAYRTKSFMVIPLTGNKFWGVINLADREDGGPFSSRDLFLGWLLGRLLVELLESREPLDESLALPAVPWIHEELPVGMAFLDRNLKVLQSNLAIMRLMTDPGQTLNGQEIFPRLGLSSQDQAKLEAAFHQTLATQKTQEFTAIKTAPSEKAVRYLEVRMVPLPANLVKGREQGLLLVEDVTELETLKQRLQLYEHLAVMGKLTLCVAHELNNPLDGIRRYLSLALMKKDDPGAVERYLAEVQKGLQKMSMSIKSLMFSANPYKGPSRARDTLKNLLQDALKIMMFQASDQRVQVEFQPPAEFGDLQVEADLYYVFINIIKNALQAMPQGGNLQVRGSCKADQVEIAFEDTGPGLPPEEQDKIFEPFYSTKQGMQGLGLGLPICQKILARYGGRLEVESRPGLGTKMQVILPQRESGGAADGQ